MRPVCSLLLISRISGRLWSRCLPAWMGKSQRVLTALSGSTHQSLLCLRLYSAHIALYTIEATLLSLSVLGSCELAPWSLHVACTTCIWDLAQCGRSCMPLVWCWGTALGLPWSEPWCSLWCCFYWTIDMRTQAMSANSVRPLCQVPCRGVSYQVAASSESFQMDMRRLLSALVLSCWHRTWEPEGRYSCIEGMVDHAIYFTDYTIYIHCTIYSIVCQS